MKKNRKKKDCKTYGLYGNLLKPFLDRVFALVFIVLFWWLYIIVAVLVRINLGSPVIFIQERPGRKNKKTGKEVIFKLYKFRSLKDLKDENDDFLSDEKRMTSFGKKLRASSLDELPEILINILIRHDMSWVGPRPQLVKDMVFMNEEQRKRHDVMPGLTGLAQVNGRNNIDWEDKIDWDLKYVKQMSFWGDVGIVLKTVDKALIHKEGITENKNVTATDYGDYLLEKGLVTKKEYDEKMALAKNILNGNKK